MDEKSQNFMRQFQNKTNHQLDTLTASQLLAIWEHYDADGNGYIEGEELDLFLKEFVTSVCTSDNQQVKLDVKTLTSSVGAAQGFASGLFKGNVFNRLKGGDFGVLAQTAQTAWKQSQVISPALYEELKQDFLDAYDENKDNRIEIRELARMLPLDENFLLVFNLDNRLKSSVEFMKIWKKYDADGSGYIEGPELKNFVRDLVQQSHPDGKNFSNQKIDEYSRTIIKIFDTNRDGKLELNEMARLLPVKENVLKDTVSGAILKGARPVDYTEIKKVFHGYDKDNSGVLEETEVMGFCKDLLGLMKPNCSAEELDRFHKMLMSSCDLDGDGKICEEELTMMLLGIQKLQKQVMFQSS